jgi:excisionase family DNA binding protein
MRKKTVQSVRSAESVRSHDPLDDPKQFDLLAAIESHTTAMTIEEVAHLFKKSSETIRRMAAQKKIPSFRMGGSVLFNPASLGYWFRQRDPMAAKASRALASDSRQAAVVH